MTKKKLDGAAKASFKNKAQVAISDVCGCYYCIKTFQPEEVVEWTDNGTTAICPRCGIDAVLGSASGFSIDEATLKEIFEANFYVMEQPEKHIR